MKKILGLLIVFTLLTVKPVLAAGPMLKFVPSTGTYTNGDTFKVNIGVDSGTEKVQGVDVVATYDPTKVEVVSIEALTNDTFQFFMEKSIYSDTGKFTATFYATGAEGTYDAKVITGDLATVTFRPKATGTINVNFTCTTGSTIDSNLNNISGVDVINCPSNINGVYTITAGSNTTTPDPTATPVPADDGGDTTLPQTGGVGTTIGLLVFGIVGILSSLALRWL